MWETGKADGVANRESRRIRKVWIDSFLTKFEMKALGWTLTNTTVEQTTQEITYYYDDVQQKTRANVTPISSKFMYFERVGFGKSILFKLFELLYKIFSAIRRWGMGLIVVAVTVWLGMLVFDWLGEGNAMKPLILASIPYVAIYYAVLIAAPLVFMGLAFLLRKMYKLDNKKLN